MLQCLLTMSTMINSSKFLNKKSWQDFLLDISGLIAWDTLNPVFLNRIFWDDEK